MKTVLEMLGVLCFCAIGFACFVVFDKATAKPSFCVSTEALRDDQNFTLSDEWHLVKSGYSKDGEKLSYADFRDLVKEGTGYSVEFVSPEAPQDWR